MAFLYLGQPVVIYKRMFKTKNIKSDSQETKVKGGLLAVAGLPSICFLLTHINRRVEELGKVKESKVATLLHLTL
jgi:hypothetical protein